MSWRWRISQANEDLLDYMLSRNSIFNEMCMELGIKVSEQMDVTAMKLAAESGFSGGMGLFAGVAGYSGK